MPLYFPRSSQEELYAASHLPADVGNDDGEPIIAERQIRIAANPGQSECGRFEAFNEPKYVFSLFHFLTNRMK